MHTMCDKANLVPRARAFSVSGDRTPQALGETENPGSDLILRMHLSSINDFWTCVERATAVINAGSPYDFAQPEVPVLGPDQKDRGLWERDCSPWESRVKFERQLPWRWRCATDPCGVYDWLLLSRENSKSTSNQSHCIKLCWVMSSLWIFFVSCLRRLLG